TALLILAGVVLILAAEWTNGLRGRDFGERLMVAFFQSVTPRTAGYNTVDIAALTSPTLFIIMLLMLIGASPGSTGGGIKTTTTAILIALVRSQAYGRPSVEIMERRVPGADVARALATATMYGLTLIVGILLVQIVQGWGRPTILAHADFQRIVFECISALGTVGLSMNYTDHLTPAGRLIITGLMFFGRLGPIAIAVTFVGRVRGGRYQYPEETVLTG
ncbi:MAG: hypothetical protein M1457_13315, partial [bacterium]|nr:hypothetical protein [bacterium]